MDGKGRWIDDVFIERLWRTVKYEDVYLHAYRDAREAKQRLTEYFDLYNTRRLHQSLEYKTPDEVYLGTQDPLSGTGSGGTQAEKTPELLAQSSVAKRLNTTQHVSLGYTHGR
jgi:hypothetical protein